MDEDIYQHRLITKRELLRLVPLSYSTIWGLMRRGKFPLSVRIPSTGSPNNTAARWRWSEVKQWLDELPRSQYRSVETTGDGQEGVDQ